MFIEAVNKNVLVLFSDKNNLPKNSLTDTNKNAIKYFWKRSDLVITKVEKVGKTVILDIKDYIAKAYEELQDNSFIKN